MKEEMVLKTVDLAVELGEAQQRITQLETALRECPVVIDKSPLEIGNAMLGWRMKYAQLLESIKETK